ncbi:TOG array regulator of axonemal microtubules protein 1-like isoform X4 [Portunus trituberculatus]|uniref:TOG array regulator of axonemal microtubules protein 1-like isoform X4 n=1 Tax=Portunus trituberculatus TaxID=210409 RepID=UPI001E1CE340|nr:TOG array regulator of axonemal microtubules protein 1-like isoform X4 [Portunus trituberculatus]
MATFENFPTPNDTYETLLPLACTPPPPPPPAHEGSYAPTSPAMGCQASLPLPASPPRSVHSRPSYSDYLASFRAASRAADGPQTLEPPSIRPSSASPDYSCLPKDKIHFILSLKEALKRHGTVPASFNKLGFFEEVHKLLADEVWQIRNEATLLILDLLPYLGPDLDACMAIVLPHLVPNLGDPRHLLRRSSLRLLKAYAAISRDPEGLVDDIITYGVSHRSRRVGAQVMVSLEHLMREETLRGVDLAPLARALLAKLHDVELQPAALLPLLALRSLVGDATFTTYLSHLSADSREKLDRLVVEGEPPPDDDTDVVVVSRSYSRHSTPRPAAASDKEYGVVDAATMNKIRHSEDWKTRAEGCEELRGVVKSLGDAAPLLPHLPHFLQLLDSLFDDNNFRISLTVLDIFRLLLDLLDKGTLLDHLRQLVHAVRKHVGDSKVVVRIENMRVFRRLLQAASPAAVVPILCDALSSHRSSRVREDSLNLIIYALMTFPSYEFDLRRLAERVSVSVADPKRRVRHAALECLAAIAQFLGPAKLGPLLTAVDRVEEEEEAPGALEAVQARLARRQLPKVSPDGLIEFSLVVPAPGRHSSLARVKGADVDWVLAGAGGGASGSQGVGWPSSLSASFTASDSYVNKLAFTHPQSSPTQRPRHVQLEESLHRKRSISDVTLDKTEDRGLSLWTTDTIDLNRTAPSDLAPVVAGGGYRGVYLGRLRQESAVPSSSSSSYSPYPRDGNVVDKGYSLLPNKYGAGGGGGTGGLGSARGGDRPASRSPSMPRRINALAPLDQGEGLVVSRATSTRSIIPPLSAVSRRSHVHDLRHHSHHPDDFDEEDDNVKSDFYDDDEGEDVASEEEVEEEEHVVRENMLLESQISRPKSSATTRDSGISVFSSSNDAEAHTENGKGMVGHEKERSRSRYSKDTATPSPHPSSPAYSFSSGDEQGRSSFDAAQAGRRRKGADATSPSRHSLPNDALLSSGLGVVGKGVVGGGGRSRTNHNDKDFRNFDYESDFETDEEDIKLANTTLTKMKLLSKKQENMKEIDRRRQDRETRRAQEERVKKYRQLEMQHSQNSLQPSSADSGDSKLSVHPNLSYRGRDASARRTYRRSPRHSPTPSPTPLARIPKSRSHNANLSKGFSKATEKRHRSLERNINTQANGVHPRETFSRTPQLVKRGQPPVSFGGGGSGHLSNSLGSNRRYAKRPPDRGEVRVEPHHSRPTGQARTPQDRRTNLTPPHRTPDYPTTPMESVGLRIAKPASSCFKQNLEPFASPPDALRIANERLNSNDWEGQVEGIEMLVRLAHHHPDTVLGNLRNINMSLMKQAKNLRSQVSRAAIQAFTCFFDTFKRSMEGDAEKIATILLNRTVDTNKFLQLDSNHALDAMLENITPSKAIPAILQEGLGHRNPAVRTNVARLVAYEVERLGASRVLSGQKDITDRVLLAAAKLAQEGSLETRQYAKQIFHPLIQQGQFDAVLKKYVPANDIRNLQKLLDNLSNEGRTVHDSARTKFATGSRYTRTM